MKYILVIVLMLWGSVAFADDYSVITSGSMTTIMNTATGEITIVNNS